MESEARDLVGPREELSQLAELNSRLVRYIQTVRSLTGHNDNLVRIIESLSQSTGEESEQIHQVCRNKIEEMKKEKEKVEANISQLKTEMDVLLMLNQDLKTRNGKTDQALLDRERLRNNLSAEREKLNISIQQSGLQKQSSDNILQENEEKLSSVKSKLAEVERKVAGAQAENDQLEAGRDVKRRSIEDQRTKIKETKQIIRDLAREKLNPVVTNLLDCWHESFERDGEARDPEVGPHQEVWSQLSTLRQQENYKISKLQENKREAEDLQTRIEKLLEEQENLLKMIEDMKKATDSVKILHGRTLDSKEEEIEKIVEKLNTIEREVEELLVIKQGLDAEIKIYKTLIDSEESDRSEENSSDATSPGEKEPTVQQSPCFTFVKNQTEDSVSVWSH